MAEHGNGQPAKKWNHYAEIVRPEMLGQWAMEKNPSLQYLHEAMQDWGSGPWRRTRACSTSTKPCKTGESGGAIRADARCV